MKKILCLIFILFACSDKEKSTSGPEPYEQEGMASYYAASLHGKKTASGDFYSNDSLTAAHNHLPLGTIIKVKNLDNDSVVTVEVNDRGPYVNNRILDLSRAAAKRLNMMDSGTTKVRLKVLKAAQGYAVNDSTERE
ncbi:septal ring lytic transglycosylase RlpA family protein [Fulvivirga sediminis]|uniref:Probable endolytic peptidoglycan transglycosylase RlpA n=1 Tax=Fulvivirga sediminis TaxID=2803949 RepID=A0A937K2F4_9BACT|nr:septal ring lytic transglycosylase RlpA family protein [Fulvivirga sediminis]MBL3658315.1 septal ring lytic transglycosylase RlpA family protein [Fulvivirga sediminis]